MHMKNDMNVCTILCLRVERIYSHWNGEAGDYSDVYSDFVPFRSKGVWQASRRSGPQVL